MDACFTCYRQLHLVLVNVCHWWKSLSLSLSLSLWVLAVVHRQSPLLVRGMLLFLPMQLLTTSQELPQSSRGSWLDGYGRRVLTCSSPCAKGAPTRLRLGSGPCSPKSFFDNVLLHGATCVHSGHDALCEGKTRLGHHASKNTHTFR